LRKEKTMTINVIDAARDTSPFTGPAGSERTLLLLLASQGTRNLETRAQEEVTIDEEDYWTQAEEANAIDPIG
jgi:hypothetical protein